MRKRMMEKLRKISTMYYLKQIVACLLVYCILLAVPMQVALATVNNPDVVAGLAGVSQSGNTTTVNMGSASAVINWDSLNTNSNEILQFLKASGNFAVLNRVIQGGATQFDGSLFGNQGHIIIVNPNGIVFGPTALIQAHKFTASALDIANTDFMNGIYNFTGGGVGEVANYGDISAEQVALIGKQVLNAGVISSPGGYVVMAAGDKVFLGQEGSNILVEVEGVTVPDPAEGIGDVINEGTIEAAGGKIVLAAGDTFSRAIDGLDSLSLAVESGAGRVGQFGTLSADGVEGDGGSITMTAGDVVALSSDSVTTANAGTNGDGGEVIVYSPETALFHDGAQIEAKGGSESGDGGFVEVSGKEHVEVYGSVDTTAPHGATGTFLIDPYYITIVSGNAESGGSWISSGSEWLSGSSGSTLGVDKLLEHLDTTNVTVQTGGNSTGNDDITVGTAISYADYGSYTYNNLTLDAHDDIIVNYPITAGTHNLTLDAEENININAAISLTSGNLMATSGDNIYSNSSGTIMTSGGSVELSADGYIETNAAITLNGGGNLTLTTYSGYNHDIRIKDDVTLNGGSLIANADDDITIDAGITVNGTGDATLTAGKDITINSPITLDDPVTFLDGHLEMLGGQSSGDDNININADITAGSMRIKNGRDVSPGEESNSDVYVADLVRLTSTVGDVVIEAVHDIVLGTGVAGVVVEAAGDVFLNADEDGYGDPKGVPGDYYPNPYGGGDLHAKGEIRAVGDIDILGNDILLEALVDAGGDMTITGSTSEDSSTGWGDVHAQSTLDAAGTIEISGDDNTIYLDDDVTAGGDLLLNHNTETADGVLLKAGNDVVIATLKTVKAKGNLTIEAGSLLAASGGKIDAALSFIDMDVDGSTLDLKQNETLDMEATFLGISNRDDTDLVAKSTYGSVTSEQAAEWQSITADAYNSIVLTDIGGDITTKSLNALHGNIEVTTDNLGQILAKDDITAHAGDVALYADGGIVVAAGKRIKAGRDVKIGYDVDTSTYDSDVTLTGEGALTVEADRHITLGGDVDASALTGGDLVLWADKDDSGTPGGDMTAYGNITNTANGGGSIDIYSSNSTTILSGDKVEASGNITLHDNTVLNGTGADADQTIDAVSGKLITDDGVNINKSTSGNVNLGGGSGGIELGGNVTGTGMTGADTMTFEDNVAANGTGAQRFDAGLGTLDADMSIVKTTAGNLNLAGDEGIVLGGNVLGTGGFGASDTITFENDVIADGGSQILDAGLGTLDADGNIEKTTAGNLNLGGNTAIRLAGNVTGTTGFGAGDTIKFEDDVTADGGSDQDFDAGPGTLDAAGNIIKTTEGSLALYAVSGIYMTGGSSQRVDAELGLLRVMDSIRKQGAGDLTLAGLEVSPATIGVELNRQVTVQTGSLTIEDSFSAGRNIKAKNNISFKGTDPVHAYLNGDDGGQGITAMTGVLEATGNITKTTAGDLRIVAGGGVELTGDASQRIDAEQGMLWVRDTITKTSSGAGDLTLGGLEVLPETVGIDLNGTVNVQTTGGSLTIEDNVRAEGDLLASEDVTFEGSIVNTTLDGTGLQKITGQNGKVYASGWIHKTGDGNLEIFGGYNGPLYPDSDYSVWTQDVTVDNGELTIQGNATVRLDGSIYSSGNMWLTANYDGTPSTPSSATTTSPPLPYDYLVHYNSGTIQSLNGDVDLSAQGNWIYLDGGPDMPATYVSAGDDILIRDWTWVQYSRKLHADDDVVLAGGKRINANGALTIVADDDIILGVDDVDNHASTPYLGTAGNVTARNDLILDADDDIYAHGNLISQEGSVKLYSSNYTTNLYANVTADENILLNNKTRLRGIGDQRVEATNGMLTANRDVDKTTDGALTLAGSDGIILGDDVSTHDGDLIFEDAVTAVGTGRSRRNQTFDADGDDKKLWAWDTITKTTQGDLTLSGGQGDGYEIDLDGDVTVEDGDLNLGSALTLLFGDEDTTVYPGGTLEASDDVKAYDDLNGEGDLTVIAGDDIKLHGDVTADGNLELYASDSTIYLYGDAYATGNILLNANTEFEGWDDQYVDADGTLTASGYLRKLNTKLFGLCKSDGSLYLHAGGDISLDGYVQAADEFSYYCGHDECAILSYGGGVSIISDTGTIFTPGGLNDTLNVPITGRSVDVEGEGIGVDLPYGPGKAAIVIKSQDTLNLGTEAALTAYGQYDTTGAVDDREGVDFLDVLGGAVIEGIPRDEGDPFDAAIYVASTDGDVDVSGSVTIMPLMQKVEEECVAVPQGTMVIDAYDTVTFGPLFEDSLAGDGVVSDVGNRLEVASRITEWLYQAIGRLPYVYGGGPFPLDYTYVLRGAGPDNPGVEDGWVLEDPTPVTPLYEEAGEGAERLTLGLAGCPVLVAAVSAELGVPGGTIQVSLANSFALNTDIQPCESCARLLNAATILRDEDGSRMAAMTQMFNDMAPGDSPYTPEMQALIATAFAGAAEGSQYATVMQYTDAFVQYLAVLSTEMGSPVADGDSLAFVMGKYGAGVLGSDNSNIAAFVATRMESGETFGK